MLLLIDVGNTNTVFAVIDGDKFINHWRIATDSRRTADEYAVWLFGLFSYSGVNPADISSAIISTVVPRVLFDLKVLCRNFFKTDPLVIGEENVECGIEINIEKPAEVGSDRIVNALAAKRLYGNSLIIIDFGTATTFDVVDGKGAYSGGVIAPGINLSLEALHMKAAKLPNIAISRPKRVVGKSTVAAMQSGIYYGYIGLIEGIVARIKSEYKASMKVIATGGLAPLFAKATSVIEHLEPDLTILGLKEIYEMNSLVANRGKR